MDLRQLQCPTKPRSASFKGEIDNQTKTKKQNKSHTHYTVNTQNVIWHVVTKNGTKFDVYTTIQAWK